VTTEGALRLGAFLTPERDPELARPSHLRTIIERVSSPVKG
jgi:hypothetical protein